MAKLFAGARIQTIRRAEGLTQADMARRLSLSPSYYNQLENNHRPLTVPVLLQLSEQFDLDPTYFSPSKDAHAVAQLTSLFPDADDATLHDLIERFPELVPRLLDVATKSPPGDAVSPHTLVRDFFYDSHNYIHDLDVSAEELAQSLGSSILRVNHLSTTLAHDIGVTVRFGQEMTDRRIFDPKRRELNLKAGLTSAQLCFEMAMQYALIAHAETIERLVAELPAGEPRRIASFGLAQYFAAAVTMPYTDFLRTAEETRYDIERIAAAFGTGIETTTQRLATLQRPGEAGVPFAFIRADRAGNISKRQSATQFHFARTGGSCPLWVVHRAFETPNRITRQVASMPDGRTYLWVARHIQGPVRSFGTPRREFAIGLGCDIAYAHRLIYSDALTLSPEAATPIGPGCMECPRRMCAQRSFPQSANPAPIDLDRTSELSYKH